ncbi:inhibitor of growth protein 4 isoform X4 [Myotis myotis]|uniref:inhibitor of growth protein 4 isoform X4 n=1 Tax=Myotis myotis TaxID=51298 RepID=UPI0017488E8A|nr:inhibitor of growth protein 4 isoform X4 [Myotis myotis]XP_036313528.1 inhibitor of growth protein 4 isoform X4 [Pipistrellus kuhlii]XP_059538039.1 inhibitor of growth protein 4 isoform X4 [Myotis daubentonii]
MAAGMYLEHYLDSIENLPFELQRNFQLMRDLDQRTEDLKAEIDKLATEYMSSARNLSSEEKLALLKQIQEAYGKCKEFGDDKVQLAMQTYEMVDKHIRRLDTDLARFEADLKEKQIESSDYDSSSSKGRTQKEKKAARARSKGKNSDEEAPKAAQKKLKLVRTSPEYGMPSVTFGSVHPSDVLDMPVDPNEPTYCLCHQVSYGEMIGCDNPDVRTILPQDGGFWGHECSIEWFHFACVGLTTKPRGKWFCPRCSQERKKK